MPSLVCLVSHCVTLLPLLRLIVMCMYARQLLRATPVTPYAGSYRLEYDMSWTEESRIAHHDRKLDVHLLALAPPSSS